MKQNWESNGTLLGVSWLFSKWQRINDHVSVLIHELRPFEADINRPLWLTSEKDDKGKRALMFSHCRACSIIFQHQVIIKQIKIESK